MTNAASFTPPASPVTPAPEFTPAPKRDWFRVIAFSAIIIFAGLFVAAPAFQGTWLWDDDQEISANFAVQGTNGMGLKDIWKPGVIGADYLPVKTTFLWAEWKLFTFLGQKHDASFGTPGGNVDYQGTINIGYHVINALFHILNALLIWNLFYRLKIKWAWLGGLLFAIHPVLVESVAWVTEQKNTLSLIFMLLSMIYFINYNERGRMRDIIISIVMFTASALSKSAVIMLPFCLVLYAWWRDDNFKWRDLLMAGAMLAVMGVTYGLAKAYMYKDWLNIVYYTLPGMAGAAILLAAWWTNKESQWKYVAKFAIAMLPFFVITTVVAVVTVYWQDVKAIGAELIPVGGPVSRIATAGMATWFYLLKCIWPFGLIPIYPRWDVVHPTFMQLVVPWLAMLAVFLVCAYKHKTWGRHVIFGLGFFFGNLVPALGFTTMSYMRITWVADHFVYISLIGVLGLVVAVAALLYEKIPALGKPWYIGIGIAALVLLAFNASFYSSNFLNETNMWLYTLSKNPDAWQAHSRFGKVLLDHQKTDDAFYHIQQSNRLRPDLAETNNNMGVLLMNKNRLPEGVPYFRRAVRLMPIGTFLFNYGNALTRASQLATDPRVRVAMASEALPAFEKYLRMIGGGYLDQVVKVRGASALDTLFSERGGVTLGGLVADSQNAALDRLLRNKLGDADHARALPLQGGAALRALIQAHVSDQLDEMLKNKSADNLEQLVKKQGGKALETLLRQRGVLDDILKQDGGDTVRAVFGMDAGNESFFGLRRARGSDAYEVLVLAMRPDPLDYMFNSLTGGDQLKQLLNASGSDLLAKYHDMAGTEAHAIITDMMGGDPVMRLQEIVAAAAAGDSSQTAQRLAEWNINSFAAGPAFFNYGSALLQAGRRDDAIRAFQTSIMIGGHPLVPQAMAYYAIVLTQSGRGKEVVPIFERLLQVEAFANDPMILSNAGIALFQAGRKDDAIRVLERALQINPNMADVQRNLELIKNAQPAAPTPSLQSAPMPIMPSPGTTDPAQMPIPAIFQNK